MILFLFLQCLRKRKIIYFFFLHNTILLNLKYIIPDKYNENKMPNNNNINSLFA